MTENTMPEPDPGNSGPEKWTEELDPEDLATIQGRLGLDEPEERDDGGR